MLKLKSLRAKDRTDVVELIKTGADLNRCRAWLAQNAPSCLEPLSEAKRAALAEE